MVHITSLVMEKIQFNPFPLYVYGSFLMPWQPNHEADHHNFSYFELSLPKQHLIQIRLILLQWFWRSCHLKQEAHGPRFAHLSDIATADMQMLCNIFPILSSQLMKISSFEQFLVLKKNIWAWQSVENDHLNKLSITFQQKDQCEIWWKVVSEESWFYTCKQHSGREI